MTAEQRAAIETATIEFFTAVLSCHHDNQEQFANILCDVIRGQGTSPDGKMSDRLQIILPLKVLSCKCNIICT